MRVTRRLVLPTVLALAAVACGGSPTPLHDDIAAAQRTPTAPAEAGADATAPADPNRSAGGRAGTATTGDAGDAATAPGADADTGGGAEGGTADGTEGRQDGTGPSTRSGGGSSEPPMPGDPDMDAVDVTATVDPQCVRPGGTVTITATAPPDAGVAYNAFYADGESGAPAPFGAGYGGNDGGMADEQGQYRDTWTVAANAPSGPGHVEVLAGIDGGYGQTQVAFAVADAVTGTCDR